MVYKAQYRIDYHSPDGLTNLFIMDVLVNDTEQEDGFKTEDEFTASLLAFGESYFSSGLHFEHEGVHHIIPSKNITGYSFKYF